MKDRESLRCAIGITVYNEAANIGQLLERLLAQQLEEVRIDEIIVVASGCTDGTEDIVREWAARDQRITLLVQARREGKASAINLFLAHTEADLIVLCSGDLLPAPATIERLVAPFADPAVGMTSSRPVPVNERGHLMGFAAHLLWELHHEMNLRHFKAGELIAFRKLLVALPPDTPTDEATIEPVIRQAGLRLEYPPQAIVYNRGPESVADFLSQRRRIYAGHLLLREQTGYSVSTMNAWEILACLLARLEWRPKPLLWTAGVVMLEAYGRFLGTLDYRRKRQHAIWEIAETTKDLHNGQLVDDR